MSRSVAGSVSTAKTTSAAASTNHPNRDPHQHWSETTRAEINRLFHVIPQNPHYNPFLKYKQGARDGIKMGLDLSFRSLARKITIDVQGAPSSFLRYSEDYRSELSEFESFGFNVTKLREIVDAKEIAAKQEEMHWKVKMALDAKVEAEKTLESSDLKREKEIENLKNEITSIKSQIEIKKAKLKEDSSKIKNQRTSVAKAAWND